MRLKNKRVVVVGGSSGIGLTVAEEVLREGGEVLIVGRSQKKLDLAISKLKPLGPCRSLACDVSDENQVAGLCSNVGAFDHLVITAPGDLIYKPFEELTVADAHKIVNAKLFGALLLVKYSRPLIRDSGSIVFTAGINAYIPLRGGSVISAANGALVAFARSLAIELKQVRVNVVSPGWVDTPVWAAVAKEDVKERMFKEMAEKLPVGRIGKSEDIADAVVFLLTNGYVTGTVLHVEGGRRLL